MVAKTKPATNPLKKSGTSFEWKIDCYEGCEHGCLYCYAWWIKSHTNWKRNQKWIPYSDWINSTPIVNLVSDLRSQLNSMQDSTRAGIKDIFVSSLTDCYQPLESQHRITRQVIKILIENELPFTILTKNKSVLDDIDLFTGYDKCRVGLTIVTLDDKLRQMLEPNSSPITDRIDTLKQLRRAGISTYCSIEPILPDERSNPFAIVDTLQDYVDLFEFGMWNPKRNSQLEVERVLGTQYDPNYFVDVFKRVNDYKHITYCHASHSKDFLEQHGMKFIPYPTVYQGE